MPHIRGPNERSWLIYKLREKVRKNRRPTEEEVKEESADENIKDNISLGRLFEAFMESAPQVVLQMYIMTQMSSVKWLTAVSVVFSLISLIWVTRSTYMDGGDLSMKDVDGKYKRLAAHVCLLVWLLLTIPPTVISMALFASYYRWILFPVIAVYWVVTSIEVTMFINDGQGWCSSFLLAQILSFPSMFITSLIQFVSKSEYDYFFKWLCVALITQFIANTVMFTAWFAASGYATWYGTPASAVVCYGYIVGIMFMGMLFYLTGVIKRNKAPGHVSNTGVPKEVSVVI
ncbi:XK-related protein 4-like [Amphiura filiformis]|uniref:XK-related protein 4-like n=1 Tax=Amphiura filiformis TaxID=82378 RepID=UPI003B20BDC8